jgi:chromosome partitioning protein
VTEVRYTAKRAAEILGKSLDKLAKDSQIGAMFRGRGGLAPADLARARETLGLRPEKVQGRRQLFLNFKGGTGKTSLSTAYAYRLWELGYRVLVIDLDSQGHASKSLGLEGTDYPKTLFDTLIRKVPLREVLVATAYPGLDLVPSNLSMSTIELALMPLAGREFKLRLALKDLAESEAGRPYDFTVMDAPPSFGLLNLNALMAANDLIVPVLADFLSFHGLRLLFETVQSLEEDLQHVLDHIFIVINAFNASFKLAKEAKEALQTHYREFLLRGVVRQCTKFAQASSEGTPIFALDPTSKGAIDIAAMVEELLSAIARQSSQSSTKSRSPRAPGERA